MSQLFQTFARLRSGLPTIVYEFNGVDMYLTIPPWTPLGLDWNIVTPFAVRAFDTGAEQVLWRAGTAAPHVTLTASGSHTQANYDDIDNNNIDLTVAKQLSAGVILTSTFSALATGGKNEILGDESENNNIPQSITMGAVNTLAASSTGAKLFKGVMYNVELNDGSTMQNQWTTQSDGVRVVNLNTTIVIPVADLFEAFINFIHGPDPLAGSVDFVGTGTGLLAVRLYGTTHATFPDQYAIIDSDGNMFRYQNGNAVEGQHVRIRIFNDATGVVKLTLDNNPLQLLAAPTSFADVNLNQFGGSAAGGPLPTGWTVGQVAIANRTTGEEWAYLLGSEFGDAVPNLDPDSNQSIDYDGTWTDDGGKVFIPNNSRYYSFSDGSGDTIRDTIGGHDGTIVNFDPLNWLGGGLRTTDGSIVPDGFYGGLPYVGLNNLALDTLAPIDHYHQGLPFTANGRIAASLEATVVRIENGATPYDANGRVVFGTATADDYMASVPYTVDGRIKVGQDSTVFYNPIQTSPNWGLVSGGLSTWESSIVDNVDETVRIRGGSNDFVTLAFQSINAADVEISQTILYNGTTTRSASFLGAVRMLDGGNYIGWRTAAGVIQVLQRFGGTFTQIFAGGGTNFPQAVIGSTVKMRVVGDLLTMTINGVEHPAGGPVFLLAAGRVGAIPRAWTAGAQTVFRDFAAVDLT